VSRGLGHKCLCTEYSDARNGSEWIALIQDHHGEIQTRVENLGSAPAPCNEDATSCPINVFYFRVVERAEQFGIQPERLLGHALAHEVGHLLGENHSPKGIMRGTWGRDDLKLMGFSTVEFSTDQAKQLRDTLSRRAAQQEASQNVKLSVSR
jgi:hypothetical protein